MGTEITLDIDGLSLTYSKNHMGIDHGALFQVNDRGPRRSEQINYAYFEQEGEDPTEMEMAFARPLGQLIPRLELMGFTLERARRDYAASVQQTLDYLGEGEPIPDLMDFDAFCAFATAHPLRSLDDTFVGPSEPQAEEVRRGRFNDPTILARLPAGDPFAAGSAYSEATFFGQLVDILHPYSVLRVLGMSVANHASDVVWQYGPIVCAGWVEAEQFVAGARRTQTFLVATEGSSDTLVLRHAIQLLRPEIIDFFSFVDVEKWHSFSGAGNLVKFAEGLAKIDVHNQLVFLFDNDAEGVEAHGKLGKHALPSNMRAMVLPALDRFADFPARGPDGVRNVDINGRAAAIECYLDLSFRARSPARVTWIHFKKDMDAYHGVLDYKDGYTKTFLSQTAEGLEANGYDISGVQAVLDALIAECTAIAESGGRTGLDSEEPTR